MIRQSDGEPFEDRGVEFTDRNELESFQIDSPQRHRGTEKNKKDIVRSDSGSCVGPEVFGLVRP